MNKNTKPVRLRTVITIEHESREELEACMERGKDLALGLVKGMKIGVLIDGNTRPDGSYPTVEVRTSTRRRRTDPAQEMAE